MDKAGTGEGVLNRQNKNLKESLEYFLKNETGIMGGHRKKQSHCKGPQTRG